LIEGNPVLTKATITNWEANSEGMQYRVMVRVFNREGSTDSPYLLILNAGHPAALLSPIDLLDKNMTSVHVKMPLASDDSSNISYELQIDSG
jgi:hypothetical protein